MSNPVSRRSLLKSLPFAALLPLSLQNDRLLGNEIQGSSSPLKGNIRQSVAYGAFRSIPLETFVRNCKEIGLVGIDLVNPDEWETVQKGGLIVTLSRAPGAPIKDGFNHVNCHENLEKVYGELLPMAGKAGIKNVICFSGNRKGIGDEEGLENCVKGLKRVVPIAEKNGVTLQMELLNSIGHKDYHADHTAWAAEIAKRVGSEHFKLLYDIIHMQIMEGNLIDTIRKYKDVIGHYHTAGVPGRNDLDDTQEINYPAVMKSILATGFKGFVGHEFSPKNKEDKLTALRNAVRVCDV